MAAEILLVHGSMLGAWCWEDTIAELAALGTEAAAFDFPVTAKTKPRAAR